MARLEALFTLGQPPSLHVTFSPVKAPVQLGPPAGLSQAPVLLSSVPSSQAAPAFGLDGTLTTTTAITSFEMSSPLENLYPDTDDPEPVFSQADPVYLCTVVSLSSGLCY